jgi:hypothetical protein
MGLDVKQLGLFVVRPTLAALAAAAPGIDGPVAECLLLGTAAQESQFRFLHQEGGPALGLWQMEPGTLLDLRLWLAQGKNAALRKVAECWRNDQRSDLVHESLVGNLNWACAMARLLYWRHPQPLPLASLLTAETVAYRLWPVYKLAWNTEKGRATEQEFVSNYANLVAPHWPPSES